ncbi:MAG: type IV pili methyl-accepting chemotaxis transducer N-terminal domain-containing protein [Neisseria sp.]|nr:type IV pili methyl-accepting chemotaxis transducer N-terminal domain-containing protein [Neisseria sp.]
MKIPAPSVKKRFASLSFRLKFFTILWIAISVASILFTLLLSIWVEGNAAAINELGSLRFQSYRLGLLVSENAPAAEIRAKIGRFDQTLADIRKGDPMRPLHLPDNPAVLRRMGQLEAQWRRQIRPVFARAAQGGQNIGNGELAAFLTTIDAVVGEVERTSAGHITWLRVFQSGLLGLVLVSSAVMMVLMRSWILNPLQRLRRGVEAVSNGNFGIRLNTGGSLEFERVNNGFNLMSSRLHSLYGEWEQTVAEKTRDLAEKNYILETLYGFSSVLNRPQTAAEAASVFLEKLSEIAQADGGSVRLTDVRRQSMDLVAQVGLPEGLQHSESCQKIGNCLCGYVAQQGEQAHPVHFYAALPAFEGGTRDYDCLRFGFRDVCALKIAYKGQDIGIVTLYFLNEREISGTVSELLEMLCSQFGVVVGNIRLAEENRQLAVLQERNLIAQGLHDSIAQALAFLNLQVQMMEGALAQGEQEQAQENLQFIKSGVQECYEDVRELLLNFRTKLAKQDFAESVAALVERFEKQTHTPVSVHWRENSGLPLSIEQQLQCVFILQESLSNIRKHAKAERVEIELSNGQDFLMTITDDGVGFDAEHLEKISGNHVGLNIMRERASRIHAKLRLYSRPGHTQISLSLPQDERIPV